MPEVIMNFHQKTKCVILFIMYHFSFRDIVRKNNKNNTNSNTVNDNSNNKYIEEVVVIMIVIINLINTIFYNWLEKIANISRFQLFQN